MDPKYKKPLPSEITAQDYEDKTLMTREEYEEDYQKTIKAVTKQLQDVEGLDISKTMKDQLRQWFFECRWAGLFLLLCFSTLSGHRDHLFFLSVFSYRDTAGTFPEYPCEEDGGSAPLFINKDPQQVAHRMA